MNIPMNNSYIEINLETMRENVRRAAQVLTPSCGIIPVLKDNAYGLGSVRIAQCLEEMPEVLGMADRVVVMREGRVMAEIERDSAHFNQEDIMKAAWGGKIA